MQITPHFNKEDPKDHNVFTLLDIGDTKNLTDKCPKISSDIGQDLSRLYYPPVSEKFLDIVRSSWF